MNGTTHLARSPHAAFFFSSLPFNVTVPTGCRPGHILPSRLCMRRLVSSAYVWVYACPRTTAGGRGRWAVGTQAISEGPFTNHERVVKAVGLPARRRPQRERDAPSRFTTSWRPAVRGSLCEPTPGVRASGPASRKALGAGPARAYGLAALWVGVGACGPLTCGTCTFARFTSRRTLMGLVRDLHLISSDPIRSDHTSASSFPDRLANKVTGFANPTVTVRQLTALHAGMHGQLCTVQRRCSWCSPAWIMAVMLVRSDGPLCFAEKTSSKILAGLL